jgi:hypothetical protein
MTVVGSALRTDESSSLASKVANLPGCGALSAGPYSVSFDPQVGWRELVSVLAVGTDRCLDHATFGTVTSHVLPEASAALTFASPDVRVRWCELVPPVAVRFSQVESGWRTIRAERILTWCHWSYVLRVYAHRLFTSEMIKLESRWHRTDDLLIGPNMSTNNGRGSWTEGAVAPITAACCPHPASRLGVNLVMSDEALHRRQIMRRASCKQRIARRLPSSVVLHAPRFGVVPLVRASIYRAGLIHQDSLADERW